MIYRKLSTLLHELFLEDLMSELIWINKFIKYVKNVSFYFSY